MGPALIYCAVAGEGANQVDSLYNQAVQHLINGNADTAKALCLKLLSAEPDNIDGLNLYAHLLASAADLLQAISCLERAASLAPHRSDVLSNLGELYRKSGSFSQAKQAILKAIEHNPKNADAHNCMGCLLTDTKNDGLAMEHFVTAAELLPERVDFQVNVCMSLCRLARFEEASIGLQRILGVSPQDVRAMRWLVVAMNGLGKHQEAIDVGLRAIEMSPHNADLLQQIGFACHQMSKYELATQYFQRALTLHPANGETWILAGQSFCSQGKHAEAFECDIQAVHANPDSELAWSNLAVSCLLIGAIEDAREASIRSLRLSKETPHAYGGLVMAARYSPTYPSEMNSLLREWNDNFPAKRRLPGGKPQTTKRLRIGILSADISAHPVGLMSVRVLESLPRDLIDLVVYSDNRRADQITHRIRNCSSAWRDIAGVSNDQVEHWICEDDLDCLIDMSGFTNAKRLPLLSQRVAPKQLTWLGNVGPLGVNGCDGFIADRTILPDRAEPWDHEPAILVATSWASFDPPSNAPIRDQLPLDRNGFVTFGSFNNPAKIQSTTIRAWATVLKKLPNSRLVLKYASLDSPVVNGRIRKSFADEGIDAERLSFQGASPFPEMLECYLDQVDVALDTFPFNGGLTTLLALWMGVPVVTYPGHCMAGRQTTSILNTIGACDFIAPDAEQFAEKVNALSSNSGVIRDCRKTLRDRIANSALLDGRRLAEEWTESVTKVISA